MRRPSLGAPDAEATGHDVVIVVRGTRMIDSSFPARPASPASHGPLVSKAMEGVAPEKDSNKRAPVIPVVKDDDELTPTGSDQTRTRATMCR